MLSASLRSSNSAPALGTSSSLPTAEMLSLSASAADFSRSENVDFDDELLFDEQQDVPEEVSSPVASPRAAAVPSSGPPPRAPTSSVAWDMPSLPEPLERSASSAACMARSLPRPIGGMRRAQSGGDGDDDGEGFKPPHLMAVSMMEPQHMFGGSLSTAKGAAALRLRTSMLERTGFMSGNLAPVVAPVRAPSS